MIEDTKICTKCGVNKHFDMFIKDKRLKSGIGAQCKPCYSISAKGYASNKKVQKAKKDKEWYLKNKDRIAKLSKLRNIRDREHISEYNKKYRLENKGKISRIVKTYQKNNKEELNRKRIEYASKNRHKISTHDKVNRAVESGKLTKPDLCEICSKNRKIEGHHMDYSKPLDVIWLCVSCHKQYHFGVTKKAEKIRTAIKELYYDRTKIP